MKRPLVIVVAALVGVLVGAAGMAALDDSTTLEASLARGEAPVAPAPVPEPRDRTLLVWTADGLPADLAAQIAALPEVRSSTLVDGDTLSLVASYASDGQPIDRTPPGEVIPLDALAIDPATCTRRSGTRPRKRSCSRSDRAKRCWARRRRGCAGPGRARCSSSPAAPA